MVKDTRTVVIPEDGSLTDLKVEELENFPNELNYNDKNLLKQLSRKYTLETPDVENPRKVNINSLIPAKFPTNKVKTSKYSLIT